MEASGTASVSAAARSPSRKPRKHGMHPHPTVTHPRLPTPFTQEIAGSLTALIRASSSQV